MKKIALFITYFIQIVFLGYLIYSNQLLITNGEQYKFRVVPVDPYDIFKGRYLTLAFEEERTNPHYNCTKKSYQKSIALITKDKNGFAKLEEITNIKPKKHNYFELENDACKMEFGRNITNIRFPFNRFYLQETLAGKMEKEYVETLKSQNNETYALVRIKDGKAVLEDLYINNKPIKSYFGK